MNELRKLLMIQIFGQEWYDSIIQSRLDHIKNNKELSEKYGFSITVKEREGE